MNFSFDRLIVEIQDYLNQSYNKAIAIGIAICILAVSGFFGYKWYQIRIQRNAQKIFSEAFDTYKDALTSELQDGKIQDGIWEEVEIAFKTAYLQNKNSTLSPFFIIYESQALYKQGKIDEAYQLISKAVELLSKNSPFYYFYKIKQSLIEIDTNRVQEGINKLNQLLEDKNNPFKGMINYYLGEYYWSINDLKKAEGHFKKLEAMESAASKDSIKVNLPWIPLVKTKLEQLG